MAALAEQDPRPALDALAHKDLIRHAVRGNGTFRFRHALIRDAAYGSLPKRTRGELHERFAATLDAAGEHDELIGFHLEHAYRYGEELAAPDVELAARAAERLERSRPPSRRSRGHLGRSRAARAGGRAAARRARPSGWRSCRSSPTPIAALGDFDRARVAPGGGAGGARRAGQWRARSARLGLLLRTEMELQPDELLAEADETIAAFERLGDERGLALAWSFRAWVPWLQGQAGATADAARRSIEHARRVGDPLTESRGLRLQLGAALWGPTRVDEGLRLCEEVLERPAAHGRVTHRDGAAGASGLRGDGRQRASRRGASSERERALLEELGLTVILAHAREVYALVELLAGDPAAAAARRKRGYEVVASELAGPTLAAIAARALVEAGEDDEALALATLARDSTPGEDLTTQVQWRGPMARLLARRGEQEERGAARARGGRARRADRLPQPPGRRLGRPRARARRPRRGDRAGAGGLRAQGQRGRRGAAYRGAALSDSPTTPGQSRIGTSDRTMWAPDSAKRANASSASSV